MNRDIVFVIKDFEFKASYKILAGWFNALIFFAEVKGNISQSIVKHTKPGTGCPKND